MGGQRLSWFDAESTKSVRRTRGAARTARLRLHASLLAPAWRRLRKLSHVLQAVLFKEAFMRRGALALLLVTAIAATLPAPAAWAVGPPLSDYVMYGDNGVVLGVGSVVTGLVGARTNNATTGFAIRENGLAQIAGSARSGADVSLGKNTAITGTLTRA